METVTSILLVVAALGLGIAMVAWGVHGAVQTWREDTRNKRR
jgi:uncharacterized protein HemX